MSTRPVARTPSELHSPGPTPNAERLIAPLMESNNTGVGKDRIMMYLAALCLRVYFHVCNIGGPVLLDVLIDSLILTRTIMCFSRY
jgi:hypothetical protein